ncbi:DUF3515 domain-containing protein [Actinomadura sp. HBU206391]|uniref:DUF3515 domain-containing protein n=1 Tax=Actinomadura sp. HBU206391 TaxID=2731692 RepID=UPI00164EF9B6|nr:DUF3515 domain-containing protein [Actinomadura sp. HBU206391]MBC6460829.1 DUF3515 domain-containing protein [Actinomadura sp. HBU206391]
MRGMAAVLAVLSASSVLLVAGCTGDAVQVPLPRPDAATTRLCEGMRLPAELHGESRRATEPKSALVTAWGSPAIAVRCGVARPAAMVPTSQLLTINGVDWFPQPMDRPTTFTAMGRQAYVEVTVPGAYKPAAEVLNELTGVIKALPPKPAGEL